MASVPEMPVGVSTTRLRVTNPHKTSVTLCLEPWGREYKLSPNQSLEIVFEADEPGAPEIFHDPDRIIVYGWSGSVARVLE